MAKICPKGVYERLCEHALAPPGPRLHSMEYQSARGAACENEDPSPAPGVPAGGGGGAVLGSGGALQKVAPGPLLPVYVAGGVLFAGGGGTPPAGGGAQDGRGFRQMPGGLPGEVRVLPGAWERNQPGPGGGAGQGTRYRR